MAGGVYVEGEKAEGSADRTTLEGHEPRGSHPLMGRPRLSTALGTTAVFVEVGGVLREGGWAA